MHGVAHTRILKEAVTAHYNRLSGVKRYNRADCDKWMAGYDVSLFCAWFQGYLRLDQKTDLRPIPQCLVEIPSYVGMDVMETYVDDPDVKFILTERDPQKWAASINKTAAQVVVMAERFPMNILKYFDPFLYEFYHTNQIICCAMAGGTRIGDPDNEEMLCRYYTE